MMKLEIRKLEDALNEDGSVIVDVGAHNADGLVLCNSDGIILPGQTKTVLSTDPTKLPEFTVTFYIGRGFIDYKDLELAISGSISTTSHKD